MKTNLFTEFQKIKKKICDLTENAYRHKIIDEKERNNIVDKMKNDTLTIGVIGQMNCGKSTFINAFIFEDNVLPEAATSMTNAVTSITYGKEKKIAANFYTQKEFEELNEKLKECNSDQFKLENPGFDIRWGEQQEDKIEHLVKYVGKKEKYSKYTKEVQIYYPKEELKGVNIVDTPGYNDPNVSREERTKEFLSEADVVILLLYAGRAFDKNDEDIANFIRLCGIGKVVIGVNKYDTLEDDVSNCISGVKENIERLLKEYPEDQSIQSLQKSYVIPISARMALCAVLPENEIENKEEYKKFKTYKEKVEKKFDIKGDKDALREKSNIEKLISSIRKIILKDKQSIIFERPLNIIKANCKNKLDLINLEIKKDDSIIKNINSSPEILNTKIRKINDKEKWINTRIDEFGKRLDNKFKDIARKGKEEIEDDIDKSISKMKDIVVNASLIDNITGLSETRKKLQVELDKLKYRTLKDTCSGIYDDARMRISNEIDDFWFEIKNNLHTSLEDDEKNISEDIKNIIQFKVNDIQFESEKTKQEDRGFISKLIPNISWIERLDLTSIKDKEEFKNQFDNLKNELNIDEYLSGIIGRKESVIEIMKDCFITKFLVPIRKQLEILEDTKLKCDEAIEEANKRLEENKEERKKIEQLLEQVESLRQASKIKDK